MDVVAARRWAHETMRSLGAVRDQIDALNVYPVADGDTGTNLYLTLEAAWAAVIATPADTPLAEAADVYARGALRGARGNSGAIAAQMMRGWADTLLERAVFDVDTVVAGLRRADDQAWEAVEVPVEGTMLTVSRAAADAADAAVALPGATMSSVVDAAAAAARTALERTPDQLAVLRDAGVVDAGAWGYVVAIESLADLLGGGSRLRWSRTERHRVPTIDPTVCGDLDPGGPAYEVMYLLEAPAEAIRPLRDRLARLGDSLVVIGARSLWHVHVHVDDAGAAVEAAIEAGRPSAVRITHFAEQVTRRRESTPTPAAAPSTPRTALVACAAGPGLARVFEAAGAVVVASRPDHRPSRAVLAEAVKAARGETVVLLPNDPETLLVARAVAAQARQEGGRVTVLPTRAQVQGLAAVAVHDPWRDVEEAIAQMSAAAGAARDGAVTVATSDGITTAGLCRVGDALGVVGGDFAVIGDDLAAVALDVVRRLLSGGGELVTIVRGEQADDALVEAVTRGLRAEQRMVEVSVIDGGQPRYPLLLAVE